MYSHGVCKMLLDKIRLLYMTDQAQTVLIVLLSRCYWQYENPIRTTDNEPELAWRISDEIEAGGFVVRRRNGVYHVSKKPTKKN